MATSPGPAGLHKDYDTIAHYLPYYYQEPKSFIQNKENSVALELLWIIGIKQPVSVLLY